MAINPPTDLILDVARAADPMEYRASVKKLRNAQNSVRAITEQFDNSQFSKMVSHDIALNSNVASEVKFTAASPQNNDNEAYKKFEAFMLQTFIQNMFTTDTPSVFGKGQAGEFWKSMMAEAMAKEMADLGGIGVAKLLAENQQHKNTSAENELLAMLQTGNGQEQNGHHTTVDNIIHKNELNMVRKRMITNA